MKEFLKKNHNKIFTEFDKVRFSPVMEVSAFSAFEYRNFCLEKKECIHPFFFCFPEKNMASLWFSSILLFNYFYEDYIFLDNNGQNNNLARNFQVGNKIRILGCVAEIVRITPRSTVIRFSNGVNRSVSLKTRNAFEHVIDNVRLNTEDLFEARMKEARLNRNAVSRIFEPTESIIIPPETLKSKVLLISGRNNTVNFKQHLRNTNIFNQSLHEILVTNNNLIVSSGLKDYGVFFDPRYDVRLDDFKTNLKSIKENSNLANVKAGINSLLTYLNDHNIDEIFAEQFNQFIEDYSHLDPDLLVLKEHYYPGIKHPFDLKTLKAIVINGLKEFELYPETLNGFIKKGIPVFILIDRIEAKSVVNFNNRIFNQDDFWLMNWSRKKILDLISIGNENINYCDISLWNSCKRFATQKINIKIFKGHPLDECFPALRNELLRHVEYDSLRKAFYQYLEPAFSLFKNSSHTGDELTYLLNNFKIIYEQVLPGIDYALKQSIYDTLNAFNSDVRNSKAHAFDQMENIFTQSYSNNELNCIIPFGFQSINSLSENKEIVSFTGFPYNEPFGHHLHNAITVYFIPVINILAWQFESQLAIGYINKRLNSGYFTEKLPESVGFPKEFLIRDNSDIKSEISQTLFITSVHNQDIALNENAEEVLEQEDVLFKLAKLRFALPDNNAQVSAVNPVECCILVFEDESYMYMPLNTADRKSKIMVGWLDRDLRKLSVDRLESDQLNVGHYFFDIDFYADLKTVLILSDNSQEEADEIIENLYLWREKISELFERYDNDFDELFNALNKIKEDNPDAFSGASPELHNLKNWLNNEDILAPAVDNLRLILFAADDNDYNDNARKIYDLRNKIRGKINSLSSAVRSFIETKYDGAEVIDNFNFAYEKNGVQISGNIKRIAAIISEIHIVDYSKTRKVIC